MGNILKKMEKNLNTRRAVYDALPQQKKDGQKRPGSQKKKGK
jgi:hypothetical protein